MKSVIDLEIDLFCKGLRIADGVDLSSALGVSDRTRAGLGSGLEVILRDGARPIHANVPVLEPFARLSPYVLSGGPTAFRLVDERDGREVLVELPTRPSWYDRKTSRGTTMSRVGTLQGTYLAMYVGPVCDFWKDGGKLRCAFCTTGLNVGRVEELEKALDDVVETASAARTESLVTFVHFNSGYHQESGVELVAPYVRAIKSRVGALVGVQLAPDPDLGKYDRLIDMGVEHFSFCFEFMSPQFFSDLLPGKEAAIGQKRFLDAMEYTARKLGKGRVSGEIIAGLEPIEESFKAIDRITAVGAFPTICIFRPLAGAALEQGKSPDFEDMREVFRYSLLALKKNGIPVGLAPNLEVSLVVLPTDSWDLVKGEPGMTAYRWRNRMLKFLARPYFRYRMRRFDPGPWK